MFLTSTSQTLKQAPPLSIVLNIPPAKETPIKISKLSPASTISEKGNFLSHLKNSIDPVAEEFLNYIRQTQEVDPNSGTIIYKPIPLFNKKWLVDMALEPDLECMSILYAKSVLNPYEKNEDKRPEECKIHIGYNPLQTSASSAFGVIPPTKPPRKCIARMTSSLNDIIMAQQQTSAEDHQRLQTNEMSQTNTYNRINQVPNSIATSLTVVEPNVANSNSPIWRRPKSSEARSGFRISEPCRWIPSDTQELSSPTTSINTVQSVRTMIHESEIPQLENLRLNSNSSTPISQRRHRSARSTTITGLDFCWDAMKNKSGVMSMSLSEYPSSQTCSVPDYSELPFCDNVPPQSPYTFLVNKRDNLRKRPTSLRHSIFINDDTSSNSNFSTSKQQSLYEINEEASQLEQPKYSSSPNSVRSTSSSIDSGQCSGDPEVNYSNGHSLREDKSRSRSSGFTNYMQNALPSYARMASTMDHILRISSSIYSLLNSNIQSPVVSRELFHKTNIYIQIIRQSSCATHLPDQDIDMVLNTMRNAERDSRYSNKPILLSDYFSIVARKMLEQTLLVFGRVITNYLSECVNKDRLLVIALEHFVHLLLFGDELCLQSIQNKAIDNIIAFCRMINTPKDSLKLLLRALAVLCSVTKGCLQLLSIGGLEVVIHLLCNAEADCSVEAAGVLTQLTHPGRTFIKMHSNLSPIILRLLELVDESTSSESLLLCMAAIANLTLQSSHIVDLLYQHNAILKMVRAISRPNCNNIFVQEQVVTTFSRLANKNYDQALIVQGAIPVLTQMLTVTDPKHSDYCKRIRYKAAVCIGTISSSSLGLKAIYDNHCYAHLCEVLKMENHIPNPMTMICTSIKQKIESTYEIESSV